MSKIARIYQGTNEIQKYYQGGVLQRLFFDWKHYIGNELNIEYAKECVGRNIVISGKTIQDSNDLSNIESIGEKEGNLVTIRNYNYKCETDNIVLPDGTKNSIETIDGKKVHIQRVWKSPQISTDIFQGSQNTATSYEFTFYIKKPAVPNIKKILYDKEFFYLNDNTKKHRIAFSFFYNYTCLWVRVTKEEFPTGQDVTYFFKNNPMYVYFELKEPIYTYLESGLYDDIVLPDGTKNEISYSNGKHIHTRKIGKYIISGDSNETISIRKDLAGSEYITFNVDVKSNMEKAFTDYNSSKRKMLCDKLEISLDEFLDSVTTITKEAICMRTSGLGFCISILRSKLETEDADGFRTWLSNNPITVYYELYSFVDTDLYYDDITYKLDEPLRSLPNGVCDTIEEGKIVRRVGKDIIDGTQDLKLDNYNITQTSRVYFDIDNAKNSKGNNNLLCNWFIREGDHGDYEYIIIQQYRATKNAVFISVLNSKLGTRDLAGMKKYFAENPLPFYYELETPIETEITPDMILINGEPITDTVGIELPNGTKDIMEKGIYTKNINKIVLDGSADELWAETIWSAKWGQTHNGAKVFEYRNLRDTSYMTSNNQNNFLYESTDTTLSPYYGTNSKELPENAFICKGSYIDFGCHFDTVEDFRNFLAENPFTIQYELATPIKIPLFSIKEGLTTLKSTNNITPQIELDCLVRDDFQNMCDNAWETDPLNANNIVTKNFIDVSNATYKKLYLENLNNFLYNKIGIYGYDENGNRLVIWNSFPRPLIMPDSNVKKIKIFVSSNNIEPKIRINHNANKVVFEEWEYGTINENTGEDVPAFSRIRTKGFIECEPNMKYKLTSSNYKSWFDLYFYDCDKNFIKKIACNMSWQPITITTPTNSKYMRFLFIGQSIINYNITKIE